MMNFRVKLAICLVIGYYLVKKYLKKTGKKIEDAFANKYADFKAVVL